MRCQLVKKQTCIPDQIFILAGLKSLNIKQIRVSHIHCHSYFVCRRTFWQHSVKTKKDENIEIPVEYFQLLNEYRKLDPFEVIHDGGYINNWKNKIAPLLFKYPKTNRKIGKSTNIASNMINMVTL